MQLAELSFFSVKVYKLVMLKFLNVSSHFICSIIHVKEINRRR